MGSFAESTRRLLCSFLGSISVYHNEIHIRKQVIIKELHRSLQVEKSQCEVDSELLTGKSTRHFRLCEEVHAILATSQSASGMPCYLSDPQPHLKPQLEQHELGTWKSQGS